MVRHAAVPRWPK